MVTLPPVATMRPCPCVPSGVDGFTVQRLAGHADAVTTARYDRRGEGERRRAAAQLRIPS
jgi:integrase